MGHEGKEQQANGRGDVIFNKAGLRSIPCRPRSGRSLLNLPTITAAQDSYATLSKKFN